MKEREKFGSRLGFILVSAGCAVGLGNVWKFPYMCGRYGGAAFILIYLIFLVALGFPIMVGEFAVGRRSKKSVAVSFACMEPEGTRWHGFGPIGVAGNYLLMMFYTTVAGWMMHYCVRMAAGDFSGDSVDAERIAVQFDNLLASPALMAFWMVVVVILALGICSFGVQKGIEKITKVMMVCLLMLIVVLAVHSLFLPGAAEGVRFYLVPDFKAMREMGIWNVVFGAMSQAFFTLSIGMGAMAIFGSYLGHDRTLSGETLSIIVLDTFVALMAGLIVIPACFAFDTPPDAGPSLIFLTLPNVFARMAGGRLWGTLFFLFMTFAALSTVVAVFENIIAFAMDGLKWSRKKAAGVNMVLLIVLSLPCVLGFNVLADLQPLGAGSSLMDLEDFLVSNNILPLGSVVYLMFCTSRYGWGWDAFCSEADQGAGLRFPKVLRGYMTWVLPVVIVFIYLKGYYDLFASKGKGMLMFWMAASLVFLALIGWIVSGRGKAGGGKAE